MFCAAAILCAQSRYHVAGLTADSSAIHGPVAISLAADYVTLYNPSTGATQNLTNVLPTQDAINSGPCAGCRDSSTAFPAGATVWFYFIGGPSVPVSVISSLHGPMTGPALPASYTSYAPAFPVVLNHNGQISSPMRIRGNRAYYLDVPDTVGCSPYPPTPGICKLNVQQSISIKSLVPVGALEAIVEVDAELSAATSVPVIAGLVFQASPTTNFANLSVYVQAPNSPGAQNETFFVPLLAGDFNLRWTWMSVTGNGINYQSVFFIQGYTFSNES
jgi:hypothetical protein